MRSTSQQPFKLDGYLMFVLLASIFTAFLCIYVIRKTKSKRSEKIKNLPGPGQHFLGSIKNILALRDMTKCVKVLQEWAKEYGPIYQNNFGPFPVIILNSPEYVEKLLSSKNGSHFHKGSFYKALRPFLKDGLVLSTGEKWKERRRVLNKHMFSFTNLQSHATIFNQEGDNLVCVLGKMFPHDGDQEGKEIEEVLMNAVFSVIAKCVFGVNILDFERMYRAEDEPFFTDAVNEVKHIVALRIFNPWLLYDPIWRLHPMSKREDLVAKMVWKYAGIAHSADVKFIGSDGKKLGIREDLEEECFPFADILEESVMLLTGVRKKFQKIMNGYETTSSSLHFALFLLALHPENQERCREEVDSLFQDDNLCPSGNIQYGGLRKLKYLEMCVNETLRILPIPFAFRKIEESLKLEEDLILPAGSHVCVFPLGIHMNPEIYPEPNKFVPERFVSEEVNKRHPYSYIPFMGGPRICIGHKFAMMELVIMIAKILRHFIVSTTDKLEDIVLLPYITLTPQKKMKFSLKIRNFS